MGVKVTCKTGDLGREEEPMLAWNQLVSCAMSYVIMSPFTQTKIVENQTYDERLEIYDSEEVASIHTPTPRPKGKIGIRRKEEKWFSEQRAGWIQDGLQEVPIL